MARRRVETSGIKAATVFCSWFICGRMHLQPCLTLILLLHTIYIPFIELYRKSTTFTGCLLLKTTNNLSTTFSYLFYFFLIVTLPSSLSLFCIIQFTIICCLYGKCKCHVTIRKQYVKNPHNEIYDTP